MVDIAENTELSSNTRTHTAGLGLVVDWLMMAVLLVNLVWLVFDSTIRGSVTIRHFFESNLASAFHVYEVYIHNNFALVDLAFVSIFVAELLVRWAIAIKRQTYHRWFFYPIIHWYDALGCIPLGSMRFLRVLRLVTIAVRMHQRGLIDVTRYYPYRVFAKYRDVLTEEVSDRVVVQVLDGVQDEVTRGSPVVERIWREVVTPRQDELTSKVTERTQDYLRSTLAQRQSELHVYVDTVLDDALDRSQHAFRTLQTMPFFGPFVIRQIEDAIKIIVNNVIAKLVEDAKELEVSLITREVERAVAEAFAERDVRIEGLVQQIVHESLDIVKDQVRVQQWKLREAAQTPPYQAESETWR